MTYRSVASPLKKLAIRLIWAGGILLFVAVMLALGRNVDYTTDPTALTNPLDREFNTRQQIRIGILPPTDSVQAIGGDQAALEFHNNSPFYMRVSVKGEQSYKLNVPACRTCKIYRIGEPTPKNCPENLPVGTLLVPPGNYEVTLILVDNRPLVGRRTLEAGKKYIDCWHSTQEF